MGAAVDCLIGKRFGNLVPIERLQERNQHGNVLYQCKCDCGNLHIATASNLSNNLVKSCGCRKFQSRSIDLLGRRFGNLVVIEKLPRPTKRNAHQKWLCKCDCGRICEASSTQLNQGRKVSCGCVNGLKRQRKQIYETITGCRVPDGYSVIFLDGDYNNQSAENMYCVSYAAYNKMLINHWFSSDPQITKTQAMIAELNATINHLQK